VRAIGESEATLPIHRNRRMGKIGEEEAACLLRSAMWIQAKVEPDVDLKNIVIKVKLIA